MALLINFGVEVDDFVFLFLWYSRTTSHTTRS